MIPDVRGKSLADIERLTADCSRGDLVVLIHRLASLEQHFSPAQIAAARNFTKQTIVKLIKRGKIQAHMIGREYRIPQASLEAWDRNTSRPA